MKDKSNITTGLVKDRKTTDCLCLLLFLATFATMIALSIYGLVKGNIAELIGGINGENEICGVGELKDYPYLYLTNLELNDIDLLFQQGVCVKECPEKDDQNLECHSTIFVPNCDDDQVRQMMYETRTLAGYCVPKHLDDMNDEFKAGWEQVQTTFKNSQAGQFFNDLQISKKAIFASLVLGFVYSTLYIYAMSNFANFMAKLAIMIIELCLVGSVGVCFYLRTLTTNSEN